MVKSLFSVRFLSVLAGSMLMVFSVTSGAFCQAPGADEASVHNQRGMEYFKKGFYDHAPKHQDAEAERNYGFAVKEFTAAISRDSSSIESHRNLARVYHVQRNFVGAAEEYKKVIELVPGDLDAYVNCALACIELQRFDEAIQLLKDAKGQTSDAKTLETLDSYIAKVIAHQAKGVR